MPGPNDFNAVVDPVSGAVTLEPGLGKDEPDAATRLGARKAAQVRLEALRAEIAAKGDEVEERERVINSREAELAKREAALLRREAAAKTGKGTSDASA